MISCTQAVYYYMQTLPMRRSNPPESLNTNFSGNNLIKKQIWWPRNGAESSMFHLQFACHNVVCLSVALKNAMLVPKGDVETVKEIIKREHALRSEWLV